MTLEEWEVDTVGPGQKQWYRVGAVAALGLGIGYIIIFPLYAYVGPPPSGADAWFKYLPGKTTVWWVIVGLSVFTDFLFVPLALALVIGFVMLGGVFNKITAYLGIATGILGIASLTRLSLAIIGNALLATAWLLLVGYRLYRLAQD